MAKGIAKWFSDKKDCGFIEQEDGPDVFAHHSGIEAVANTRRIRNKLNRLAKMNDMARMC